MSHIDYSGHHCTIANQALKKTPQIIPDFYGQRSFAVSTLHTPLPPPSTRSGVATGGRGHVPLNRVEKIETKEKRDKRKKGKE